MEQYNNLNRVTNTNNKHIYQSTYSSGIHQTYAQLKASQNNTFNSNHHSNFHQSSKSNPNNNYLNNQLQYTSNFIQSNDNHLINNRNNNYLQTNNIGNNQNKNYVSYYDPQRSYMKNSLIIGTQDSSKIKNSYINDYIDNRNIKRPYRNSQINFDKLQMKMSTMQISNQNHKVPSFLQQKFQKKKSPYIIQLQRPQSEKQGIFKTTQPENLRNSSGSLKNKFGSDGVLIHPSSSPSQSWSKGSWNKKKQKQVLKFDIQRFQKIKDLGTGKYGQVFLVRQKYTNFICALKIIQKKLLMQQQITQQFIRELKIQSYLNHPNIVKMYGFFDDIANIYIILQAGTSGQLFKQLKKHQCMPQIKVANLMRQICQAIKQLHSHRIIHRDIKPQNIVISEGVVKLCDFGWSVWMDSKLRSTFCGTPLYVGPQILRGKQYDQKIDIWSLGVMMYQMLVGQNPFNITKQQQLIKIVKDAIKIPSYVQISDQGKDFLYNCLQKNPQNRMNIRQLLNHQFFKKYPDKADRKMNI